MQQPSHHRAALTWKGLVVLFVAAIVVAGSVLWVWWPTPAPLAPAPAPPLPPPLGRTPDQSVSGEPRPRSAPAPGGSGVPVRILLLTPSAGNFTVELCDATTTEVLIRWYTTNPPSGPVVDQQRVQVVGGQTTLPLAEDLTPTAQSLDGNRAIGAEIGPGQSGLCP